jgi:acyl-CoA thioesterase FadM
MDITDVPIIKLLGISKADGESGFLLQLDDSPHYHNHLGTVSAAAQLALAEATSAECLQQHFPDLTRSVLAVVRRMEAKFRNPLKGKVRSRATIQPGDADKFSQTLRTKGRALIAVQVQIVGVDGSVGLMSVVEWFVQKQAAHSA